MFFRFQRELCMALFLLIMIVRPEGTGWFVSTVLTAQYSVT
jgi:hypothetical protein